MRLQGSRRIQICNEKVLYLGDKRRRARALARESFKRNAEQTVVAIADRLCHRIFRVFTLASSVVPRKPRISHAAFLAGRRIYVGRCVEAVRVPQAGRRTAARVHPIVSMEALSLLASPPLGAARAIRSRRAVSTPAERSGEFVTRRCKSGRKADESPCFSHVAQRFSDAANGISRHRVGVPARVRSLCHLWLIAGGGAACVHLARCRFAEQQACQQQSQCA